MKNTEMTPEDLLWIAIIERTPKYLTLSDDVVRAELKAGGFPERVVNVFLVKRRSMSRT